MFFGKSRSGKSLLLVGLAEAGKTTIFSRLTLGKFVPTVTSMKQNNAEYPAKKRTLEIVDLPGHDRLRSKYWEDYKSNATGIVFVVDSQSFLSNVRDVADFLYTVLADPVVNKRRVPVLIACNKQDEAKAKSAKVIQNQLEKEINTIRATRLAALESTDGSSSDTVIIGNHERDFQYSDLRLSIEFVNCSASDDDIGQGLKDVVSWVDKL